MEYFLGFVFICLVLGAVGIVYGKKEDKVVEVEYVQQGTVRTHADNRRKLNISQPVSEMIRIIESGEGFTFNLPEGVYGCFYYLRFGESRQIMISNDYGGHYTNLDWMTKDETVALADAFYGHLAKEKISAEQTERNRWCEMLGVTQTVEEQQ